MTARPKGIGCILGPGSTDEVSWRRGEEMGKDAVKKEH